MTLGVFIEELGMEDFSARARVFLDESCDTSSSASLPGPQSLSVFLNLSYTSQFENVCRNLAWLSSPLPSVTPLNLPLPSPTIN